MSDYVGMIQGGFSGLGNAMQDWRDRDQREKQLDAPFAPEVNDAYNRALGNGDPLDHLRSDPRMRPLIDGIMSGKLTGEQAHQMFMQLQQQAPQGMQQPGPAPMQPQAQPQGPQMRQPLLTAPQSAPGYGPQATAQTQSIGQPPGMFGPSGPPMSPGMANMMQSSSPQAQAQMAPQFRAPTGNEMIQQAQPIQGAPQPQGAPFGLGARPQPPTAAAAPTQAQPQPQAQPQAQARPQQPQWTQRKVQQLQPILPFLSQQQRASAAGARTDSTNETRRYVADTGNETKRSIAGDRIAAGKSAQALREAGLNARQAERLAADLDKMDENSRQKALDRAAKIHMAREALKGAADRQKFGEGKKDARAKSKQEMGLIDSQAKTWLTGERDPFGREGEMQEQFDAWGQEIVDKLDEAGRSKDADVIRSALNKRRETKARQAAQEE